MPRSPKSSIALLLASVSVVVFTGRALAAPISLSDELLVTDAAGTILFDGTSGELNPENTIDFSIVVPQFTESPAIISINFREPDTGRISDVLIEVLTFPSAGHESVQLTFISDFEGGPILDPAGTVFAKETGSLQDVTSLLDLDASGMRVQVISDVDVVPEPASLLLCASGLAVTAARGRRARRC
jgi:hypothetical protein